MRRTYLISLLSLLLLLLAAGCAGDNQVVNQDTEEEERFLRVFSMRLEPGSLETVEAFLSAFMEDHKGTVVSYDSVRASGYYEALTRREQGGLLDDVFMVDHDTGLAFAARGSLADLSRLAEEIPFSPALRGQLQAPDGKVYWLPAAVSAFGLYCNLDLLEAHHQKVPANLGEWEAVCRYFVQEGITPILANNDSSLKTLALAKGFAAVYAQGQEETLLEKINRGEEPLSRSLRPGFALAQDFCAQGFVDRAAALVTQDGSDDLEAFARGENPFLLGGAWGAGQIKELAPSMRFQVVPYPVLEDGAVLVINPDLRLSVSARSGEQALARSLLAEFFRKENLKPLAEARASFCPLAEEHTPAMEELRGIVEAYRDGPAVIGSDSRLTFPVWDRLEDVSRGLLAGESLPALMRELDLAAPQGEKGGDG